MTFVFIAAVFIAIAALAYFLYIKQKNDVYEGVVVDKVQQTTSDSEGDERETYLLKVQLPDGNVKNKYASKKIYDQFEKGDKIVKRAGEYNPVKG